MSTEVVVQFKSVGDEDVIKAQQTVAKQIAQLKALAKTPIETKFVSGSVTSGMDKFSQQVMAAREQVKKLNEEMGKTSKVAKATVQKPVVQMSTSQVAMKQIRQMQATAALPIESSMFRSAAGSNFAKIAAETTKARTELALYNKELGKTSQAANQASGSLGFMSRLLLAMAVRKVTHDIVELADVYTNFQNKLKVVTNSQQGLNVATSELIRIANTARAPLDSVSTVFSRTARAVEHMGKSQWETTRFTETLVKAIQVGGSTATESSNAMIQLSQGMASGALRGDELRSVLEQMPIVAEFIAKKMGVTVGQLRELGREGKLTTDIVFGAMIDATATVEASFAKMTPTIAQSFDVLKNRFLVAVGEASSLTNKLSEAVLYLANNFETVTKAVIALGAALSLLALSNIGKLAAGFLVANPWLALAAAITAATVALITFKDEIKVAADEGATLGSVMRGVSSAMGDDFDHFGHSLEVSWGIVEQMSRGFGVMADAVSNVAGNIVDGILRPLEMAGLIAERSTKQIQEMGKTREDRNKQLAEQFIPKFEDEMGKVSTDWGLLMADMADQTRTFLDPDVFIGILFGIEPALEQAHQARNNYLYERTAGAANRAQAIWEKSFKETNEKFNVMMKGMMPEPGLVKHDQAKKEKGKKEHGKTIQELIEETNRQIELEGMGVLEREIAKSIDKGFDQLKPSLQKAIKALKSSEMQKEIASAIAGSNAEADRIRNVYGEEMLEGGKQAALDTALNKKIASIKAKYAQVQNDWQKFIAQVTQKEEIEQSKAFMEAFDKMIDKAKEKVGEVHTKLLEAFNDLEQKQMERDRNWRDKQSERAIAGMNRNMDIMRQLNPNLVKQEEIEKLQRFKQEFKDLPGYVKAAEDAIRELQMSMNPLGRSFLTLRDELNGLFGENGALVRGFADVTARAIVMNMSLRETKAAFRDLLNSITQQALSNIIKLPLNVLMGSLSQSIGGGKIGEFSTGGYTGNVGTSAISGVVHGQEYVVNAAATKKYRPMLEAINSGKQVTMGKSMGTAAQPIVNIHNNAPGVEVKQVPSPTTGEVELIVTKAIRDKAGAVIAKQITDSNSIVSKAIAAHVAAERRRT